MEAEHALGGALIHGYLRLAAGLGIAKAGMGLVALAMAPTIALTANFSGIPRWVPHSVSAVLAVVAVISLAAMPRSVWLGSLGAFWALGSGAFARPALRSLDWPIVPVELLGLPVVVIVAWLACRKTAAPGLRYAAAMAVLGLLVVVAAILLPASPLLYAGAYGFILAAAGSTGTVAYRIRRSRCTPMESARLTR